MGRPHRRLGLGELAALVPRDRIRPRLRRRPWHGDDGPIPISRYPRTGWLELQERFAEAALAAGHDWVNDHNRPGAIGIGPVPLNMVDGVRQTPADHYLDPALARPNLELRAGVIVDRVVLEGGVARAVEVIDAGPEHLGADAVVMALGTYATPAALLRSGIGPGAELARHGIPVPAEVAGVGRGMQDHPEGLLPLRAGPRGAGLAGPLVPVPADRRPRGGRRAARLPGDALLGHRRGRPALHRPERPGRRRALAAGDRAPAEPRPGRPAGDRDGLVPRALGPGRGRRGRAAPDGGGAHGRPWRMCSRPGPASTTPTRSCGPSRPSTTRSAPAGWAARTTPRRSSTAPGACAPPRACG